MKKIKIFSSTSNSVYHNLALEEHLLLSTEDDILLFYVNEDAVVVGKHQNPWLEVNLSDPKKYAIARRLSGGGTVYHDLGNINFAFLRNKQSDFVNFKEHIIPISKSLMDLGIKNTISERNDIFIGENKISGNAEHVNSTKKRILHHGTLLYNSNLQNLSNGIKPKQNFSIKTHAVCSVRSPIMNCKEVVDLGTTHQFLQKLIKRIPDHIEIVSSEAINPLKIDEVNELVKTKYTTWKWIYGRSPSFSFTNSFNEVIKVKQGKIESIESSEAIDAYLDLPISYELAKQTAGHLNHLERYTLP